MRFASVTCGGGRNKAANLRHNPERRWATLARTAHSTYAPHQVPHADWVVYTAAGYVFVGAITTTVLTLLEVYYSKPALLLFAAHARIYLDTQDMRGDCLLSVGLASPLFRTLLNPQHGRLGKNSLLTIGFQRPHASVNTRLSLTAGLDVLSHNDESQGKLQTGYRSLPRDIFVVYATLDPSSVGADDDQLGFPCYDC